MFLKSQIVPSLFQQHVFEKKLQSQSYQIQTSKHAQNLASKFEENKHNNNSCTCCGPGKSTHNPSPQCESVANKNWFCWLLLSVRAEDRIERSLVVRSVQVNFLKRVLTVKVLKNWSRGSYIWMLPCALTYNSSPVSNS